MHNLLERLIGQLDTLVAFLAISRKEAFDLIRGEWEAWVPDGGSENLPESHEVYRTLVTHAAFLLGYSYFEAFLSDLVRETYAARRTMLPKNKELKYSDILSLGSFDAIVQSMIEKNVRAVFGEPMSNIIKHFEEKLHLEWPHEHKADSEIASCLRNCIIHNLARVDARLAGLSQEYEEGDQIRLTESEVNTYGLAARAVASKLYEQACQRHLLLDER